MDTNDYYLELTDPRNIINNFKDQKDFEKWLDLASTNEQELLLEEFVNSELYNLCKVIKNKLNGKEEEETSPNEEDWRS